MLRCNEFTWKGIPKMIRKDDRKRSDGRFEIVAKAATVFFLIAILGSGDTSNALFEPGGGPSLPDQEIISWTQNEAYDIHDDINNCA